MKTIVIIIGIVMLGMAGYIGFLLNNQGNFGSVAIGGEYHATSTADMTAGHVLLQNYPGTLGSLIVASSSAQTMTIWNATSTTDTASTSFGSIIASLDEGTYTFDSILTRGLVLELPAGSNGEIFVTYR